MTRRRHVGARGEVGDAATGAQTGATQRRLLLLLCRGERTVNELAAEFGVTDNAVRAQLQRLARIGLVRQVGSRPGTRRPHAEYELTVEAAKLFPTAYAPAGRPVAGGRAERADPRRPASPVAVGGREAPGALQDRRLRASGPRRRWAELVERLGGPAAGVELLDRPNGTLLRSCVCPLAAVTGRHPATCEVVAELLSELVGAPVREVCTKGDAPRCSFAVTLTP